MLVYKVYGNHTIRFSYRFVIEENINQTGVSFFAIFDGHGGEFAADYAKDYLVQNLYNKIIETSNIVKGITTPDGGVKNLQSSNNNECHDYTNKAGKDDIDAAAPQTSNGGSTLLQRRSSLKKSASTAEDCSSSKGNNCNQDVFVNKLNSIIKTKDRFLQGNGIGGGAVATKPQTYDGKCYIDNGKINFGKMLTDEVLAADYKLVEAAKKTVSHPYLYNFTLYMRETL